MTRMIQGYSETMRHLKDGLDVVGDDLAEMLRRVDHPQGRKGARNRGLESDLGIPGHPGETVTISLGSSLEGDAIKVLHRLGRSLLSCTVDGHPILRTTIPDYVELPDAVRSGMPGGRLSRIVDMSETSIPGLGEAIVREIFVNGDGTVSIYLDAPGTRYAIAAFLELKPTRQGEGA